MKTKQLKNKSGEVLTTKEGQPLEELRFEVGDQFIPIYNTVLERKNEVESDGKKKVITNYTIKCRARDKEGNIIIHNDSDELFVTLTPAQATTLKRKVDDGVELNQNLFVVYEYESKEHGTQIGVGLKHTNRPAKSFEDFAL